MDNRARWAREAIPWNFAFPFSVIFIIHSVDFRFSFRAISKFSNKTPGGRWFAVHYCSASPMIMALPGVCLLELASEGIEEVDYCAAEHFCVIREFLNAPEKVLGELFEALRRLLPIAWVLRMPSVAVGR